MTADDDRVRALAGELELDDAELAALRAELADESVWAEPPPGLEDAVVADVQAAVTAQQSSDAAVPTDELAPRRAARRTRWTWLAAAAVVVIAGVLTTLLVTRSDAPRYTVALQGTELASGASGSAALTRSDSGWEVELDATGLPRLDGGRYYQAWLRNADGVSVPIGTFNEGTDVVLWSGVSPKDYPTMTVTREEADGDQASSGQVVLSGQATPAD